MVVCIQLYSSLLLTISSPLRTVVAQTASTSVSEAALDSYDIPSDGVSKEVTVLELSRGVSSAQYAGTISPDTVLRSLTACGRFYVKSFSGRDPFMHLRYTKWNSNNKFRLEVWSDKVRPALSSTWRFLWLPDYLKPNYWYHMCLVYAAAGAQSKYLLYLNGEEVASLDYELKKDLYADEFYAGYSYDEKRTMDSFITQVNLWDYALTHDEIMSMANCTADLKGNYVSWEVGFNTSDAKTTRQNLTSLCQKTVGVTYMWFPDVNDEEAFYICDALGTHLPLPMTLQECYETQRVSWEAWSSNERYSAFITPLTDKGSEGVFYRNYDRQIQPMDTILWGSDEPNGNIFEDCVSVSQYSYFDVDCAGNHCATCKFEEPRELRMRGTCARELRNVFFLPQQVDGPGSLEFKGFDQYWIKKTDGRWVWSYVKTAIATMDPVDINYPMGRRVWTLTGKMPICGQKSGQRVISLSVCSEGQFTCDDARCISHDSRCDLKYDCQDQSDEQDCDLVFFPPGYRSDLPPTNASGGPAAVALLLSISTLKVDTSKTELYATYLLQLMWQDNRLSYRNLKALTSLNMVPPEVMREVWIPVVGFVNTEQNEHTVLDDESMMNVVRRAAMERWNSSSSTEEAIYSGVGNDLHLSRKYTTLFFCDFDLNLYPFDVQTCPIELRLLTALSDQLELQRDAVEAVYIGSEYLIEYQVGALEMQFEKGSESDTYRDVTVRVTLGRRSGYAMLTIYIPSLILLIICYVTLFFRPEIFEVRVMAALTSLLVVATLFTQASSSLPKTSYFKMVDIWLLFCIGVIFLIIIFHALVDASLSYEDSEDASGGEVKGGTTVKRALEKRVRRKDFLRVLLENYFFSSSTGTSGAQSGCEISLTNDDGHITKSRRRNDEKLGKNIPIKAVSFPDRNADQEIKIHRLDDDSIDIDVADLVEARVDNIENPAKISGEHNLTPSFNSGEFPSFTESFFKKTNKSISGKKQYKGSVNYWSNKLILSSKIIILLLVAIFNLGYWGYILT